jgi:hypothetical protein
MGQRSRGCDLHGRRRSGEWFIHVADDKGWYKDAGSNWDWAVRAVLGFAASVPVKLGIAGLAGLVAGIWLDSWLVKREKTKAPLSENSAARLPRYVAYWRTSVSIEGGGISAFNVAVVNNNLELVRAALVRGEIRLGANVIAVSTQAQPQIIGHMQLGEWKIAPDTPVPNPQNLSGYADVEIEYDDVPPRGIRRSKATFKFPGGTGGACATIVDQEES